MSRKPYRLRYLLLVLIILQRKILTSLHLEDKQHTLLLSQLRGDIGKPHKYEIPKII